MNAFPLSDVMRRRNMNVLNFGRFITIATSALAVIKRSSLLQNFLFSITLLRSRVFHYFERDICRSFLKALLPHLSLEVLIYG